MIVLVTGGRDFNNVRVIGETLDCFHAAHPFDLLVRGCATGVDTIAAVWAMERGIQPVGCPALWDFHGKAAGAKRNSAMLALEPDVVIVFPGGRGTANMRALAIAVGVTVIDSGDIPHSDLVS